NSHMQPRIQFTFNGSLNSNAPLDMISALGKNGQIINIVPSKKMVIVRMGNDPDTNSFISAPYNNQLWEYINKLECSSTNTNYVISEYKKKLLESLTLWEEIQVRATYCFIFIMMVQLKKQ
ncbi:hypothetical protein OA257_01065, partial [Bacteroidota bacterium]|nr:hypothetical protein [Bacteroidota bacterium]